MTFSWLYDPGEGKKKHAWNRDEPGFEPSSKGPIGKCPCSITREIAETLLNNGFPVFADDDPDVPERIYNVYKGVVYEARRTEYGKSFHGFPWRGDKGISRKIPARIIKQLEARAKEDSELREFKRWMKKYGGQ